MDILTLIGITAAIIGIIAGVIQVLDYLQKRREKTLSATPKMSPSPQQHLTHLRQILTNRFDEGELQTLCFDLGIDYDILPGDDKADKARELIEYLERRGRIPELVETGKRLRPDIPWDGTHQASPQQPIPHNLPPRSEFVGREAEKAQIHQALCSHLRLISIDGIGGIGKTSLALEVAYECLQASLGKHSNNSVAIFDGFIWATAKDRELLLDDLLDTIARTLDYPGIAQKPAKEKPDAVNKLLRIKPYLLIVDNFETINDERIGHFLLLLPEQSKALITTRKQQLSEALAISLKQLTETEGLALIINEGRRLGLTSVEQAKDEILLTLYQATGGAPLAIKWAVGQIKQRGQSLNTVLATIRGARASIFDHIFARSWELLSNDARCVLMVMPIFTTSALRAGIEAASDIHHSSLDEALGQLVEMSLVDATDELDLARRRYSIHPLTRAFGMVKLREEPGFQEATKLRLAKFYQSFTKEHGGWWQHERYAELEIELPSIMAIIRWCWEQRLAQLGTDILRKISSFLSMRGYWNDAIALGQQGVELATEMEDELSVARFRWSPISWVHRHRGDFHMAEENLIQALAVFERLGEEQYSANVKRDLGRVAQKLGMLERAELLFSEALTFYQSIEHIPIVCLIKTNLAEAALERGNLEVAWNLCNDALSSARSLEDPVRIAGVLYVMGDVARQQGDIAQARLYWDEALHCARKVNQLDAIADTLFRLAQIEIEMGQTQMAQQMLSDALKIYQRLDIYSRVQKVQVILNELSPQITNNERIAAI